MSAEATHLQIGRMSMGDYKRLHIAVMSLGMLCLSVANTLAADCDDIRDEDGCLISCTTPSQEAMDMGFGCIIRGPGPLCNQYCDIHCADETAACGTGQVPPGGIPRVGNGPGNYHYTGDASTILDLTRNSGTVAPYPSGFGGMSGVPGDN
jgi:hypothetical protein